jgi:hypothetical protein
VSAVEEKIGVVTDYLDRVGVAVVRLTEGDLRLDDRVRITGRTTELQRTVPRPRLRTADRLFWVLLSRLWAAGRMPSPSSNPPR